MSPARRRVPDPVEVAAAGAFSAMASGFLAGRILAALAALLLGRLRSWLTTAHIDVLRALGRDEAARRMCRASLRRLEERRRALAGRQ